MMYRFLRAIVRAVVFFLYRVQLVGRENGKIDGPTMVICNHKSNCDPIMIHMLFRPKIRLMAKKELFDNKMLSWLITKLGAFPVSRGTSDVGAVSNAINMITQGELVGIFPEGTRIKEDKLGRFQPGVAMIAMRAKASVIPVYINRKLKLFHKTIVIIGTPVDLSSRVDKTQSMHNRIVQGTDILQNEMQYLRERAIQMESRK